MPLSVWPSPPIHSVSARDLEGEDKRHARFCHEGSGRRRRFESCPCGRGERDCRSRCYRLARHGHRSGRGRGTLASHRRAVGLYLLPNRRDDSPGPFFRVARESVPYLCRKSFYNSGNRALSSTRGISYRRLINPMHVRYIGPIEQSADNNDPEKALQDAYHCIYYTPKTPPDFGGV